MDFDKLWNYNDPAATEQKFRELLPGAPDQEYRAQLLTQIARTEGLQGKFDDAHRTLDEAIALIDANELGLARARYLLERGRAYNSSGQPEIALPLFIEAHKVASSLSEHRYSVDALHMVAIAEGDPKTQVEWNLKAIEEAERTGERGWLFALYNNIGESYLQLQQYQQAYDYFRKLAGMQAERKGAADIYTLKDQAKAARLNGNPAESETLMLPLLNSMLEQQRDDGYIRQEYAEALYALGMLAEAKPHFAKAYEILSNDSWISEHDAATLDRLKLLAQ